MTVDDVNKLLEDKHENILVGLKARTEQAVAHIPAADIWKELQRTRKEFADYLEMVDDTIRLVHRTNGVIIAINPVHKCPKCGAQAVDYDGMGLVACPRDPLCYCAHPSSTQAPGHPAECDICKREVD